MVPLEDWEEAKCNRLTSVQEIPHHLTCINRYKHVHGCLQEQCDRNLICWFFGISPSVCNQQIGLLDVSRFCYLWFWSAETVDMGISTCSFRFRNLAILKIVPVPESQILLLSILRCSNTPAKNARPHNFGHVKVPKWRKSTQNHWKPSKLDGFDLNII